MTNDKQDDAALKAYKERVRSVVDRLKNELDIWVCQQGGEDVFRNPFEQSPKSSPYYTEVTSTLLETAIDRQIHLLGETDARDLVMSAFERRAKVLRQLLQ